MKIFRAVLFVLIVTFLPISTGIVLSQDNDLSDSVIVASSANWGNVRTFPMSELVTDLGVSRWRSQQWTGRGQKVGVLDLGFGGLIEFESNFDLNVTIPEITKDSYNAQSIVHGTQVLEVINGIATEAELYACQYEDFDSYRNCIDWFILSEINIINHSAGVPALPLDGTNDWAIEVERASREGILWVNSAGNFANGFIRGNFTYFPGTTYNAFFGNGSLGDTLEVPAIGEGMGRVML